MFVVAGVALGLVFVLANYADTSVFQQRMKQTREGTESDDERVGGSVF
jgi:hypothetical protein